MPTKRGQVIADGELLALRAMCQGALDARVWDRGIEILGSHPFQDSVHQLVFDTLREMNTDDPRIIRGLLAARLTNKGFPDVNVETYFEPHNLRAEAVVAIMQSLAKAERRKKRRV